MNMDDISTLPVKVRVHSQWRSEKHLRLRLGGGTMQINRPIHS